MDPRRVALDAAKRHLNELAAYMRMFVLNRPQGHVTLGNDPFFIVSIEKAYMNYQSQIVAKVGHTLLDHRRFSPSVVLFMSGPVMKLDAHGRVMLVLEQEGAYTPVLIADSLDSLDLDKPVPDFQWARFPGKTGSEINETVYLYELGLGSLLDPSRAEARNAPFQGEVRVERD